MAEAAAAADLTVHGVEAIVLLGQTLALAALAYIGLKIKNAIAVVSIEQLRVKEELLGKHNDMREDMNKKHNENSQAIAVHQAEDALRFDSIARTLTRMDTKLDNLNGKSH